MKRTPEDDVNLLTHKILGLCEKEQKGPALIVAALCQAKLNLIFTSFHEESAMNVLENCYENEKNSLIELLKTKEKNNE